METKYGIKHSAGVIIAVSEFSGEVGEGFIEITKQQYNEFLNFMSAHPTASYDPEEGTLIYNAAEEIEIARQRQLSELREKLLALNAELSLSSKLEEEPGEIQAEFNSLKTQYNDLKG